MTCSGNISKVQFHKIMAFVVKLLHFCHYATPLLVPSKVPSSLMVPDSLFLGKIVSCHLKGKSYTQGVPNRILLSLLCQYLHLCRICWDTKVRNLSFYATTSATGPSIAVINTKDCTLNTSCGKEIGQSWEKPVIAPCLHGRSVQEKAKRAEVTQQGFKMRLWKRQIGFKTETN